MSPGSFLAIQTLFFQLGGILSWLGLYLRQMSQASIDLEDLYNMLNTDPVVKEKLDAKEFVFKNGHIKFENLTFKHYYLDETEKDTGNQNLKIDDENL